MPRPEITPTWLKVRPAAAYSGVSERTILSWLKEGLRHARLPSGTVLVKSEWIDDFLGQYEVVPGVDEVDRIVNQIEESL